MVDRPNRACRPARALGVVVFALAVAGANGALAGVAGSKHDFSALSVTGGKGVCAACHLPHAGLATLLWSRDLTQEVSYFDQISNPDYLRGNTLLCYDCHDNHAAVDDDPEDSGFVGRIPQDVAFDRDMKTTNPRDGLDNDDVPGYYENIPSLTATPVSTTVSGHYVRNDPGVGSAIELGDKLPCSDCHDPHATTNQAFIRATLGGNPVSGVQASAYMAYDAVTRDNHSSRDFCIACHGTSEQTTHQAVRFSDINSSYGSNTIAAPPVTTTAHREAATVACTSCHPHNRIIAKCDDCHGYPPTTVGDGWSGPGDTDENYPGGAGAHLAHIKGAGMTAADPTRYAFGCLGGACHPEDRHNEGNGIVARANIQIVFNTVWNPNGTFAQGTPAGLDACGQLYCHSNGLVENGANPTDNGTAEGGLSGRGEWAEHSGKQTFYGTTPASPVTWGTVGLTCRGCHGKGAPDYLRETGGSTTAVAVSPPDYLNAGTSALLSDGQQGIYNTTGANTHFIHVYKLPNHGAGSCSCHGATASTPGAGHVNRQIDVVNCGGSCHNGTSYTWGAKFGADTADSCVFWCHGKMQFYDSAGGRVTKNAASAFALDQQPKYMQSGHGLPASSSYASGNPGAGLACSACHLATDRFVTNGDLVASYHYERMPQATGYAAAPLSTNPYWLKTPYAADPDGLCENCHDGSPAIDARNHTAQDMITSAGYNPKYDSPPGTWTTFSPNCVSCHDPHGEPNWYMLYDGDSEKSSSALGYEYAGPVIHKGTRFGVTRAQADQYGVPPGPNFAANQTAVVMSGRTGAGDFVNAGNNGICQVCHTLTQFYRRDGSSPGGAHISAICTDCHQHWAAFTPKCEACHSNSGDVGCDGIDGTADDAPNVMGDGAILFGVGSPRKPFDDGTYGFNVNGHGANGSAPNRPTPAFNPNRACVDCHDLSSPQPNTHRNCVNDVNRELNTYAWPGKAADTRNENTSHLVPGFLAATTDPQVKQLAFDDYCYTACHLGDGVSDMRHSTRVGGVPDGVMQFSNANDTTDDPKQDRGLDKTWTPWTVDDLDVGVDASPPGVRYHGVCVSCHDPHGTATTQKTRSTNKMLTHDWKGTSMATFCGNNCHRIP